jgi:hypothetical protein
VNPKIYYRLENFYANHRNFVKSRSYQQLRGGLPDPEDIPAIEASCTPIVRNKDLQILNLTSINGKILEPGDAA